MLDERRKKKKKMNKIEIFMFGFLDFAKYVSGVFRVDLAIE